jgi:streptogramin lyase
VAVAPDGTVVVADTFGWRITEFTADLKPTGISFGKAPTGSTPGDYDLYGPRAIAFDAAGNMWVTDTGDDRIQVYTLAGKYVRTIGGKGSGPGQFSEPVGISIASDGVVFVADMYNSRVEILNPDGSYKSSFTVEGWGGKEVTDKPYLTALTDGRVAVGVPSEGQVRIYTRDGHLAATITDNVQPLDLPYGIAETSDGKLWVVEGGSARVREFTIP